MEDLKTCRLYNFLPHINGDTSEAKPFVLERKINDVITPIILTGCKILCQIKNSRGKVLFEFNSDAASTPTNLYPNKIAPITIDVVDGVEKGFTLTQVNNLRMTPGLNVYDIQIIFPTSLIKKTYVRGNRPVIADISELN